MTISVMSAEFVQAQDLSALLTLDFKSIWLLTVTQTVTAKSSNRSPQSIKVRWAKRKFLLQSTFCWFVSKYFRWLLSEAGVENLQSTEGV